MTEEQFRSNAEQMEAFNRDFITLWDNAICPLYFEYYPNASEDEVASVKQHAFDSIVTDAWIDTLDISEAAP